MFVIPGRAEGTRRNPLPQTGRMDSGLAAYHARPGMNADQNFTCGAWPAVARSAPDRRIPSA